MFDAMDSPLNEEEEAIVAASMRPQSPTPETQPATTIIGRTKAEWHKHIDDLIEIAIPGEDIPEAALLFAWRGVATPEQIEHAKIVAAELEAQSTPPEQRAHPEAVRMPPLDGNDKDKESGQASYRKHGLTFAMHIGIRERQLITVLAELQATKEKLVKVTLELSRLQVKPLVEQEAVDVDESIRNFRMDAK